MVGSAFARAREREFLGVCLGIIDHILQRGHITVGAHHNGIGGVMEHINRSDIISFKAHVAGFGLDHDVGQVDAHNLSAISGHRVQLRPTNCTATAGLIGDHKIFAKQLFKERLLEPCGHVGFTAGTKWNDIVNLA